MISISEAGRILGVTTRTLKRWDQTNVLPTYRTLGNHRRYKQSDVEAFMGLKNFQEDNSKNVFIYARVSTKKQAESGNLKRQKERLVEYCNTNRYHVSHIYEEIASGMNDLVSIVTCFSARLYGARGEKKVKQTLEALEQERQVERLENHNESDIV